MLALEVRVNGELKAICGAQALEHLVAWFSAERKGETHPSSFEFMLRCQGHVAVAPDVDEVLKWVSARMNLGDEVSLRFVEADRVHTPIDRQQYPSNPGLTDA
jgi:hypothetical protein